MRSKTIATKHLCPWGKDFVLGPRTESRQGFHRPPATVRWRQVRRRTPLGPASGPLSGLLLRSTCRLMW